MKATLTRGVGTFESPQKGFTSSPKLKVKIVGSLMVTFGERLARQGLFTGSRVYIFARKIVAKAFMAALQ